MPAEAERTPPRNERRRGVLLVLGGLVIGGAMFVALIALRELGVIEPDVTQHVRHGVVVTKTRYPAYWGIPAIVPLFATLLGTIQIISGRSFRELGKAYETTTGGRRFLLGVLVVALAVAVIGGFVAIAFAIML